MQLGNPVAVLCKLIESDQVPQRERQNDFIWLYIVGPPGLCLCLKGEAEGQVKFGIDFVEGRIGLV